MKKLFKYYAIIWLLVFCLLNMIFFVVPFFENAIESPVFWMGYSLISLVCVLQFFFYLFRSDDPDKVFFNSLLGRLGFWETVIILIASIICIFFYTIPIWAGIVICAVAVVMALISLLRTKGYVSAVSEIETRIENKALFIRSLTIKAKNLLNKSNNSELKEVYEAIRFSDPISCNALKSIEEKITLKFEELSIAVINGADDKIFATSREILTLISKRNEKCRLEKQMEIKR